MTTVGTEEEGAGEPDGLQITRREPDPQEWDAFVEGAEGSSYCHLSGWFTAMADGLGHRPIPLQARNGTGQLKGVLPLVRVQSRLFGDYLVSMPFLNYGGPLGSVEARALLTREALELARGWGVDLLELRCRSPRQLTSLFQSAEDVQGEEETLMKDGDSGHALTVTGRKVSVVLPLPDDPKTLWTDGLRSKVRSQVRRPMKEGLEARFGIDQIGAFYHVFAANMRDLGTPVLPRRLFDALPVAFGDRVRFCVVVRNGEPVAAGCGFRSGTEFEITWASSLREHSRVAPNMLLYWSMMERAIQSGERHFNFGRCTPGTGSHRFKRQWGGEDVRLPWGAWAPDGRLATPNPEEGRYARAIALWRRLPVKLTRWLGPPLARRIP